MITAIIQCRYGSTRLPGKALLKIGDKTILHHCVETAGRIQGLDGVMVATGSPTTNGLIIDECKRIGVECFSDYWIDEDNVLERMICAGIRKATPYVLRLCADSPFYDTTYADRAIEIVRKEPGYDYYAYYYKDEGLPTVAKYPFGDLCEIISLKALVDVHLKPRTMSEVEHVTPYIYTFAEEYKIRKITITELPLRYSCIDTELDLKANRKWYKKKLIIT